ncbi:MAG: hypothetical protein WD886_04015 [Burkholderiales bacterium]
MNKRKLATLVAASFAGLMLSSPSFATDANKAQTTSGGSTSAQTPSSGSTSGSTSAQSPTSTSGSADASSNTGTNKQTASERAASSQKAEADAKADYKAAVEKCDAQPTAQRASCVQDAEAAQTLAMEKNRDGTPATSGAPESRTPGQQSLK